VCEKNNDVQHDFHKDPLKLIKKGDWLKVSFMALQHSAELTTSHCACNLLVASLRQTCIHHGSLSFSMSQAPQPESIHCTIPGHVNYTCAVVGAMLKLRFRPHSTFKFFKRTTFLFSPTAG
jgi:hypothetical protein